MHLPRRRLAVFSLAAAASLVLGTSTLASAAGEHGSLSPHSGTAARTTYAERAGADGDLVGLDLLALNDFHGNLAVVDPASSSGKINNTPAGGVAYLASLLKAERQKSRAAGATPVTVAAG